jgi:hypothetical protein
MKFLTSEGKIAEGEPLTDLQLKQRTELVEYFHREACHDAYHARYERERGVLCEKIANHFISRFKITRLDGIAPLSGPVLDLNPVEEEEPPVVQEPIAFPLFVPIITVTLGV